jgi:hypothetical protein
MRHNYLLITVGVVGCTLAFYARGCEFDTRTHIHVNVTKNASPFLLPAIYLAASINGHFIIIIIINLLISSLVGHRPSLWITHAGPLVGANNCKCSRDQRLNVPSEARWSSI